MYEIIRTSISKDKKTCYYLYRHKAQVEDMSSDTYGISASCIESSANIYDAVTDENTAVSMLGSVSEQSVSASGLSDFVLDYLSAL